MARPPAPAARRKSIRRSVRLSAAEDRILAARAREDGMTISDEFRRAVSLPPLKPPVEIGLLAQIHAGMGKIGSNANQVARVLNEGGYPEAEAFRQVRRDIAWIGAMLAKALGYEAHPGPQ